MKFVVATLASLAVGWLVSDVLHWHLVLNIFLSTAAFGLTALWYEGELPL